MGQNQNKFCLVSPYIKHGKIFSRREKCMSRTIDFEKIQLTDDIMFSSVLGNPEHCQEFLERILGFKIKELHIMGSQKSMKPSLYSKGIRLGIYAKDEQGNAR